MLANSIRNEGTNVLKEISSMNRKSNSAVQYGMSSKKPKAATQTYSSLASNSKLKTQTTQKATNSTQPKPSALLYYPISVPIQLSDEKLNEISTKIQPVSNNKQNVQSTRQLNSSALLSQKRSPTMSGRQTRA